MQAREKIMHPPKIISFLGTCVFDCNPRSAVIVLLRLMLILVVLVVVVVVPLLVFTVGKSTSLLVIVCTTLIYLKLPGVQDKVLASAFLAEFKVLVSNGAEPAAAVVILLAAKNEEG